MTIDSNLELLCRLLSPASVQHEVVKDLAGLEPSDWAALAQTAQAQGVGLLFFDRLNALKNSLSVPTSVIEPFRQAYYLATARSLLMQHEAARMLAAFNQNQLGLIALKGLYLAEHIYPDASLRAMGDLDLMVKKDAVPQVIAVLQGLGYHLDTYFNFKDLNRDIKHVPPMSKPGGPIVELHWTILEENEPFTIDADGLWRRALPTQIAGVPALALSHEDLLLHLCLHFAYQHHLSLGLRGLYDIALLVQQVGAQLDWDALLHTADDWGARRVSWLGLKLAEEILGVKAPSDVVNQLEAFDMTDPMLSIARYHLIQDQGMDEGMTPDMAAFAAARGPIRKLIILVRRVFIPWRSLARQYGADPGWLGIIPLYCKRAADLTRQYFRKIQLLIKGDTQAKAQADRVQSMACLLRWMVGDK